MERTQKHREESKRKAAEIKSARERIFQLQVEKTKDQILSAPSASPKAQLNMLLAVFNPNHMSVARNKSISNKTQNNRHLMLHAFLDSLNDLGFRIRNIYNLNGKHIEEFLRLRESQNSSAGYLANYHSALRALMRWLGKDSAIKPIEQYLKNPESAKRQYIAVDDKSWESQGIDVYALIDRVSEYDERVGMVMRLMHAFGLRKKEGVNFKPHIHISLDETHLEVIDGTKGGRPREVPIETEHQRLLIKQAQAMCKRRNDFLLDSEKTLAQNMSRMDNVCKKFNIVGKPKPGRKPNPDALGITLHGLRHGYASRVYAEKTGHLSPVQGGSMQAYYAEETRKARLDISERLGHARIGITNAYLGGRRKPKHSPHPSDQSTPDESMPVLPEN